MSANVADPCEGWIAAVHDRLARSDARGALRAMLEWPAMRPVAEALFEELAALDRLVEEAA